MYSWYRQYVYGTEGGKDLNDPVVPTLNVGNHEIEIVSVVPDEQWATLVVRDSLGDTLKYRLYLWETPRQMIRGRYKLSSQMWKLFQAALGTYNEVYEILPYLETPTTLLCLKGVRLRVAIQYSSGVRVVRGSSSSTFWLTDVSTGGRLEGTPYTSYKEAIASARSQGLNLSWLTIVKWEPIDDNNTDRNRQLISSIRAS